MGTTAQGPRAGAYDAIVIGAGFGGLSAAGFMAKSGRHVLLVDGQDGPGGVARVFRRGAYVFDPAVHVMAQARPGLAVDLWLKLLEVDDQVDFLPIEHMYGTAFPGLTEHLPVGREAFLEVHARHFPDEMDGLRDLLKVCARVTRESQELPPALNLGNLDKAAEQYPTLFEYRTLTVSEAVDRFLRDPRAKAFVTTSWPYLGLPPDRLSFFAWSGMLMSALDEGWSHARGSFQTVADAFTSALQNYGGEFLPGTWVERILVDDGKVKGVDLGGGRVVRAPIVVSNADARHTFEDLVGLEHLPAKYLRRFRRLKPSLSAVVVFSATRSDMRALGASHETFVNKHWDPEEAYRDIMEGRPGGMWITVPTITDPSLAPDGEHLVIATSMAPYDVGAPWSEQKERYQEAMLADVEALFPGYRDGITHLEVATPETFARFARLSEGGIYGWANTPHQAGTRRPNRKTPIEGLYLAGHWSQPGSGTPRAMFSGLFVAMDADGEEDMDAYLDDLLLDAELIGPPKPSSRSMAAIAMVTGIWQTQLVYVAAKLAIADLITDHGPMTADRLAEMTATHPRSLYRVLRALTTLGLLEENERKAFRLTPIGKYLRTEIEGSVRHLAIMFGEPWHWDSWGNLLHSVKTGEPAFEHTWGMGTYEYVTQHPEAAAIYDRAMTDVTMQTAPGIADHYDWRSVGTVMDVGGGHGTLLKVVLEAHPHLKGMLFDLPHVVAGAHAPLAEAGLTERCEILSGDVFAGLPKGADAVMAKSFIHSFDDDTSVELLRIFKEALPPEGGRVLSLEMVLPDDNERFFGKLFDIEMLTQSDDGRDRTESEFRALFERAGLRMTRIVDTGTPVSVVEGVPA